MDGDIIDLIFSPAQAAAAGMRWLRSIMDGNAESGPCVVCGIDTPHQLFHGGDLYFVHHPDDKRYVGCKDVWRYRLTGGAEGPDLYRDYQSYIASAEWQIKATVLKRLAGWTCERCGRRGNSKTLHAHHRHYGTLYRETRDDLECLCVSCHKAYHEGTQKLVGR